MKRVTLLFLAVVLLASVAPALAQTQPLLTYWVVGTCTPISPDMDTLTEDIAAAAELLGYEVVITYDDPGNVWRCGTAVFYGNRIDVYAPGSRDHANAMINLVLGSLDYDAYHNYELTPQ